MISCCSFLATTPSAVLSTYSGQLWPDSPYFDRHHSTAWGSFYYQAIEVTVSITGSYIFASNSFIDTYGLFYNSPFDPFTPTKNLITADDESGGLQQFLIDVNLQSGRRYALVVTTYRPYESGSFVIRAYGPGSINLTGFTPSSSSPVEVTCQYIRA